MSKRKDGQARGKYTLEFKLEAVRPVKSGQAGAVTAKILGVPVQTRGNWVRLGEKGQLKGVGDKAVLPEQMELTRLRVELARVKMERDILKKATAYLLCQGFSVKYAWIAKHKALWPITLACEVGGQTSGYFEHWRRKDAGKPCWYTSRRYTLRSRVNTASSGCSKGYWPVAYELAKTVFGG